MTSGTRRRADVVVVGGGLVGSVVARWLADGGARVLVLDAGSPASAVPGTHLRNVPARRARDERPRRHGRALELRDAAGPRVARPLGDGVRAGRRSAQRRLRGIGG